jgi:hypothetical protein
MGTFSTSMQYTIGTALSRAQEQGHRVEVLAEGHWLTGLVVASDGVGVVLDDGGTDHAIVRLESVAAVRVRTASPFRRSIREHVAPAAGRTADGAVPMPPPRQSAD